MGWREEPDTSPTVRQQLGALTKADREALKAAQVEVRAETRRRFEEWRAGGRSAQAATPVVFHG
jgi:hypothetical protein